MNDYHTRLYIYASLVAIDVNSYCFEELQQVTSPREK